MEDEPIPDGGPGCPRCGSDDVEDRRPSVVEGVGDWLRAGGRWRPSSRVCRRCGNVTVAGSVADLAPPPGWWSVPLRLAGVLRRRRSRVPAPATYLLAAVAGTVLGVAAQLALGWPWWLVAGGVVTAVWLLFLSSAFWGGAGGRSLATEALLVVDPARGLRREHQAMAASFRAAPFPLYGLPASWAGRRHLGGYGQHQAARDRRRVVTSMSLAHGDPLTDGPELRVEVRVGPEGPGSTPDAELRALLADDLRWNAALAERPGPGPAPPAADPGPPPPAADPGVEAAWSEVMIPVDGRPVAFAWLAEGRHWVAYAELQGRTLVLSARDLPVDRVALVRITDIEPYLEGTRELEEARTRSHDPPRDASPGW
jgi:hypothetical protein